jgi:hypothetical protein
MASNERSNFVIFFLSIRVPTGTEGDKGKKNQAYSHLPPNPFFSPHYQNLKTLEQSNQLFPS